MAANNNMLYFEYLDRKLNDGQTIEIAMHNNIGDISMDKDFARGQINDLVGGHATVGAADPQNFGGLLLGQICKKFGIILLDRGCPLQVFFEEMT